MSFFSKLSELIGEEYSLHIAVQQKKGKMSVSVIPKATDAKSELGKLSFEPIVLSGPPDLIDQGFIAALSQPLGSINKLAVSGESFTKKPASKKEAGTKKPEEEKPKAKSSQQTIQMEEKPAGKPADKSIEETVDESSGEVMPLAVDDDSDNEPAAETQQEESSTDTGPGQEEMFNEEEW